VDFLLVLIELFSLGVTAEELQANIGWKLAILLQWGSVDPKFQVVGVAPHQPFFRMVYKSGQIFLPFCHKARVWQTDRQDRILIA